MKFYCGILILILSAKIQAKAPDWYGDLSLAMKGCDQEFLCVMGEGESTSLALGNARAEVAKYFQNKIQSKSEISSSSEQKGQNPSSATFSEWANKTMSEEASEVVSGLEIKRQEIVDGRTYVLLILDRSKTAKALKEKIMELDIENSKLLEKNSRFAYPKLIKNLTISEAYSDRYRLLSNLGLTVKVKKETVLELINKLTPVKMSLLNNGKKLPTKLNHLLIDILSPLKIVFVQTKLLPKYTLKAEVITEEQYLKVPGFKKLNVQFRLDLIDSKSEVVLGKISAFSEQLARSSEQAIEKAIPDIKEALQDNLDQLSNGKFEE